MSIAEKLTTIAENQEKVYEAGKDAEWNAFWDSFQQNGTRRSYTYAFLKFPAEIFKPKYDIIADGSCANGFQNAFDWSGSPAVSLKAMLEECGVVLDLSNSTNVTYVFRYSRITEIPTVSTISAPALTSTFADNSYLHTIEKVVLKDDGSQTLNNCFSKCPNLQNLVIKGKIGQNGFNVQWSTNLTHDSLMSIINALADKSADTSGTTWTLTLGSTNLAKLTAEEKTIADAKGWALA